MATIMPTMPLTSLNPTSVVGGTGSYTIPAGYHGFLQASTSSAAASATVAYNNTGGNAGGVAGGSGSGGASSNAGTLWVKSGSAISVSSAASGTTDTSSVNRILIDGQPFIGSTARGYAHPFGLSTIFPRIPPPPALVPYETATNTGSGAAISFVGWAVSLFLN